MTWLLDANILVRLAAPSDPLHSLAREALNSLVADEEELVVSLQCIAETWNVLTRPPGTRGGIGLAIEEAHARLNQYFQFCTVWPEPDGLYAEWLDLVLRYGVSGIGVHDARHAAWMIRSGVTHILTFNVSDFARYAGITHVSPSELAAASN